VAVELWEIPDATDVGRLVKYDDQRRVQPATGSFGGPGCRAHDAIGQGGHEWGGRAGALLGQQVQRLPGGCECGDVELAQVLLAAQGRSCDPRQDGVVAQALRRCARGLVDPVAGPTPVFRLGKLIRVRNAPLLELRGITPAVPMTQKPRSDVVGPVGLEPTTRGLKVRCSAN
jgi:hypothetical protein